MLLERYEKLAYEEIQDTDESYSASDCEAIKVKILLFKVKSGVKN